MELKAEDVKNIRSLAICKELLRQAIELNDQLNEELRHQKHKRGEKEWHKPTMEYIGLENKQMELNKFDYKEQGQDHIGE